MLKNHSGSNKINILIKHRVNPLRVIGGRKKFEKIRNEEFERNVKVFPEIPDLLLNLRDKKNVYLGIFTHDPELVDPKNRSKWFKHFGIPIDFDVIITDEKDKGKLLKSFLEKNQISHGIVIGDTQYDLDVGKDCKLKTVGATWGYSDRDELLGDFIVDNPKELYDVLKEFIE